MKKHQLLEKAMRDYPKGTRFESCIENNISTGIFCAWKSDYYIGTHKDSIWRVDEKGEPSGLVYNGFNKEWAKIIPASILSGKVAIQVNNEREFKLLMEHYEAKGWMEKGKWDHLKMNLDVEYWTYDEVCYRPGIQIIHDSGYTIIPFASFAAEVGIKVPVKIMTSEEAAEAWIKEQNSTEYKEVELFDGMVAHIYTGEILVKDADRTATVLRPSDLKAMLHALKSMEL